MNWYDVPRCQACGRNCKCSTSPEENKHDVHQVPNSIRDILWFFDFDDLKGDRRRAAAQCHDLAWEMAYHCANHHETAHGLRKLLEARDCFLRARL